MAHIGFDSTGIEPREAFTAIPAGMYAVEVVKSDVKETKESKDTHAGDSFYIELEMDVKEGKYKGRKVWDRINFRNKNPKAVEIANRTLSAICHAIGVVKLDDTAQTHGRPMVVKVGLGKNKDGTDNNVVKGYFKPGEETTSAPASPGKPANNGQRPPWAAR